LSIGARALASVVLPAPGNPMMRIFLLKAPSDGYVSAFTIKPMLFS
jgi:hypothetical protein